MFLLAFRTLLVLAIGMLSAGCVSGQPEQDQLGELSRDIEQLDRRLQHNQTAMEQIGHRDYDGQQALEAQLSEISQRLESMPGDLSSVCRAAEIAARDECDSEAVRTIVVSDDKLIVGELERVWIDPPGVSIVARVDTGAQSSSLHAEKLVSFERDGDDWIRFDVQLDREVRTIERKVKKFVRVFQQADREGSRRPVIEMRLTLGDVEDVYEFTLADRSHLDYEMLLGRNFLTDIALVDVSRQFVQQPPTDEEGSE
jgi:hypothetical protein